MLVKHRLADASYWVYDRARHSSAFAAAAERGSATDFSGFEGAKYAVVVTFRKDGTPVPTPVWFTRQAAGAGRGRRGAARRRGRRRPAGGEPAP